MAPVRRNANAVDTSRSDGDNRVFVSDAERKMREEINQRSRLMLYVDEHRRFQDIELPFSRLLQSYPHGPHDAVGLGKFESLIEIA